MSKDYYRGKRRSTIENIFWFFFSHRTGPIESTITNSSVSSDQRTTERDARTRSESVKFRIFHLNKSRINSFFEETSSLLDHWPTSGNLNIRGQIHFSHVVQIRNNVRRRKKNRTFFFSLSDIDSIRPCVRFQAPLLSVVFVASNANYFGMLEKIVALAFYLVLVSLYVQRFELLFESRWTDEFVVIIFVFRLVSGRFM